MEALHTGLHISQTNFAAQVCLLREVFGRGAGDYDLFADEVAATMPVCVWHARISNPPEQSLEEERQGF